MAIGIPSSGYQAGNAKAAALAAEVNENLKDHFGGDKSETTTFVPFPFDYEMGNENWHNDTLHFSEKGYKVLGASLVEVVENILLDLDDPHQ